MGKNFKSPFPVLNIPRRQEAVATDWVYSDTPCLEMEAKGAQFFCGRESLVCDVFSAKTDGEFINALEDVIWKRGSYAYPD